MALMTYDEYQKVEHETPYTFILKSKTTTLYFFGERHTYDPSDKQWLKVKEFWSNFLRDTKGKKRVVFVEGGLREYYPDESDSILKQGGPGFVTHLAHTAHLEINSPEPSDAHERSELLKQFSKEEIEHYYFARVAHQWLRKVGPKPEFEAYISKYLEYDKEISQWNDFDFSLESLKNIHMKIHGVPFDETDKDFLYNIVNPIDTHTVTNRVSRRSGEIRDEYILAQIQKYTSNGYSIYAQFGASHAVIEESSLREFFKYKDTYTSIALEIEVMYSQDQNMRKKVSEGGEWDQQVDIANTKRAKEIITQIGYPTVSKVGADVSHHFWFFIQHADTDLAFQKECLELMKSCSRDDINQSDIAYLEDRVRSAEGKPLLYGTQFWTNPETGTFESRPIEDIERLDERRASMGMKPFAEYKEIMMRSRSVS